MYSLSKQEEGGYELDVPTNLERQKDRFLWRLKKPNKMKTFSLFIL
jgi:hypothetical protein